MNSNFHVTRLIEASYIASFRFLHNHQDRDDHGRVIGYRELDKVAETLAPVLIRRRKSEVLNQLPERLEKRLFVPMTQQQWKHHMENRETVARIVAKWRRYHFLSDADQRRLMIALQNMRMSCNSTYLLDHETDHGVKCDEITTQLEEVFEDPASKVVIFSQWTRMHELLLRRFQARDWDTAFFHGGLSSPARKKLVERFRGEDRCRTFLSTDAGGVGLNLQHADVVVNMDLPWNPAVLEQRIGRVHRLGQTRPVRVINLISQGTIEEGMLNVLEFKKSLFAGVLDGGANCVSLEGGRFKRFMEGVEKVTSSIPEGSAVSANEPDPAGPRSSNNDELPESNTPGAQASAENPWTGIFQTGMVLLEKLASAAAAGKPNEQSGDSIGAKQPAVRPPVEFEYNQATGKARFELNLPPAELGEKLLQALNQLAEVIR